MCELLAKPWYLGKNHKNEKLACRLRQFDIHETPFMNKYGNTKGFIIILGSGHFSGQEVRWKLSSVTTHRIPRNENALFYKFAIIQCPISQLYIKRVCEQYFNHVRVSEGNGERIKSIKLFIPECRLRRKPEECHTNHIS